MKKCLFIFIFYPLFFDNCLSQNLYIGIQSGIEHTFKDENIHNHANYGIFLQSRISQNWSFLLATEFFQKKKYGRSWQYELRGTMYEARNARLWQNYSIQLAYCRAMFRKFYIGFGVSGNLVRFKKIVHDPFWPIIVTETIVKPNIIENEKSYFIKPGIFNLSGWEVNITKKLIFMIQVRFALLFGGKDFGYGRLNTLQNFSVLGGLKAGL